MSADTHIHLINYKNTGDAIAYRGELWGTDLLEAIGRASMDSWAASQAIHAAEVIGDLVNGKDDKPEIRRFMEIYFLDTLQGLLHLQAVTKAAGIDEAWILDLSLDELSGQRARILKQLCLKFFKQFKVFVGWSPEFNHGILGDGVKIYPKLSPGFWERPETKKFLTRCAKEKVPVVAHCSRGGMGDYPSSSAPEHFLKALVQYPGITLVAAHAGGGRLQQDELLGDIARSTEELTGSRLFVDLAFHDYKDEDYMGRLGAALEMRPDRVLWGSDYPLTLMTDEYKDRVDWYKAHVGEYMWRIITEHNPREVMR